MRQRAVTIRDRCDCRRLVVGHSIRCALSVICVDLSKQHKSMGVEFLYSAVPHVFPEVVM